MTSQNNVCNKHCYRQLAYFSIEIIFRIIVFTIAFQLEKFTPFVRVIQPQEMWLYKNPPTVDYVPASILMPASFIIPFTVFCLHFLISHDRHDFIQANMAVTMCLGITGIITNILKLTVGRPRPDFYYRCFPDGVFHENMHCTGDIKIINEGRKSFPSGHSAFAFAGFGFIFFYLAGKLKTFNGKGRGHMWRLCLTIIPLIVSLLIAISRTCDYHHHWEDVVVGSFIGLSITFVSYRQYYPSIFATNSYRSLSNGSSERSELAHIVDASEEKPLLGNEEKMSKWI